MGLVIEKDDEYAIQVDEYLDSRELQRAMAEQQADAVRRQYFPIRDKYIVIVKNCRRMCIEAYDKRGRKDFKRTAKTLFRLSKLVGQSHLAQE